MKRLLLLKLTVFLAAFLLFQIELIISKALLPGFGGSYLVWAGCVLFFQVALLLGYGYTFLAERVLTARRAGIAQMVLPFLPLLMFPLRLSRLVPQYRLPFMLEITWLLVTTVGPAFLFLSTVSVMSQHLLGASDRPERADPYFLYGTSNLGSFLALITYPFLVEPLIGLDRQLQVWQIAFAALALLQAPVVYGLLRRPGGEAAAAAKDTVPASGRELGRWVLLAAAGSAMFLAVTNVITFELAAIPLFWILPLAIYLLSFYLNFKARPWCPAWLKDRFFLTVPLGVFMFMLLLQGYIIPPFILIPLHLSILLVFCMFCQNELLVSRPAAAGGLTRYYLALAAGGAAGSALVSFVMPLVSALMLEYLVGFLLAAGAVLLAAPEADRRWQRRDALALLMALPVVLWPMIKSHYPNQEGPSHLVAVGGGVAIAVIYFLISGRPPAVAASLLTALVLAPAIDYVQVDNRVIYKHRNFYGIYHVFDNQEKGERYLRHGATLHGAQYLDPAKAEPLMYYHPSTPFGLVMGSRAFAQRRVAVVGLGTGSSAYYSRAGDEMDYYELDPDNLAVARKYFRYLDNSQGKLRFIFGDARRSLTDAAGERYDIIVVDAFNSDSIPVHLITTEAIELYFERLNPGGLILLHISNRSLSLSPIIYANAQATHVIPLYKADLSPAAPGAETCEWMVLTTDPAVAQRLQEKWSWIDLNRFPPHYRARPWTDRYSNLISAIFAGYQ
jgi:SAM-dependent methyltransferase